MMLIVYAKGRVEDFKFPPPEGY